MFLFLLFFVVCILSYMMYYIILYDVLYDVLYYIIWCTILYYMMYSIYIIYAINYNNDIIKQRITNIVKILTTFLCSGFSSRLSSIPHLIAVKSCNKLLNLQVEWNRDRKGKKYNILRELSTGLVKADLVFGSFNLISIKVINDMLFIYFFSKGELMVLLDLQTSSWPPFKSATLRPLESSPLWTWGGRKMWGRWEEGKRRLRGGKKEDVRRERREGGRWEEGKRRMWGEREEGGRKVRGGKKEGEEGVRNKGKEWNCYWDSSIWKRWVFVEILRNIEEK